MRIGATGELGRADAMTIPQADNPQKYFVRPARVRPRQEIFLVSRLEGELGRALRSAGPGN